MRFSSKHIGPKARLSAHRMYRGARFGVLLWVLGWAWWALVPLGWASPGGLDVHGGHFDAKTNQYHYHRPIIADLLEKHWHLRWSKKQLNSGEIAGVLAQMRRPNAVWVWIENRGAYQELAARLTPSQRNDKRQWVRIWLQYIAPSQSASLTNPAFAKWLRKQVIYRVSRRLKKQPIRVLFTIPKGSNRALGMLLHKKQNINLWIVRKGWSFYIAPTPVGVYHQTFVRAENHARKTKQGLWKQ